MNAPSSVVDTPGHSAIRVSWPHVVLSVIGAAISVYAIRVHLLVKAGADAGCGITDTISCDKVLASRYGEFFGIPLGAYGLLFFAIVLLTAIVTNPQTTHLQVATQRLIVSGVGFLTSVALTYISFVIIKAACPVCLSTHATTFTLLLVSSWQYWQARKASTAMSLQNRDNLPPHEKR